MKKTLSFLFCLCCTVVYAQTSTFQSVAARYKTIQSATATVTKNTSKGTTAHGTLTIRKPDMVSIMTNGNKEKLVMQGATFTMTYAGRDMQTDSRKNQQFTTFHTVLTSLINGGMADIASLKDVTVEKTGQTVVITITPPTGPFWRRGLFKSFVLVLDNQTSAFKTLKMVERGGNYTTYTFTEFKFTSK